MINLQTCQQCLTVHYPQRDICPSCLSQDLTWQDVSGAGKLVSLTELHISTKSEWRDKLPLVIGLVKLNVGPVILAFCEEKLPIGSAVTLTRVGDSFHIQNRNTP